MDELLRQLERQASMGDLEAQHRLARRRMDLNLCHQCGLPLQQCPTASQELHQNIWCLGADCNLPDCHRCNPSLDCELKHPTCLELEEKFEDPCNCRGLDGNLEGQAHELESEGCLGAEEGPFCGSCRQPCEVIEVDFGIGSYEYWGSRGYDSRVEAVSNCCEETAYEDPWLNDPISGDSYGGYRRNADVDLRALEREYLSSRDSAVLGRYLHALQRTLDETSFDSLSHYYAALERLDQVENNTEEIIQGLARTFFADAWASQLEGGGISFHGDYYHDAPQPPIGAVDYARQYANHLTIDKGFSLNVYYHSLNHYGASDMTREFTPEHFGYLLAMTALGHGVGLWEHFHKDIVEVPMADGFHDFYICSECGSPEGHDPGDLLSNCEECDAIVCGYCWINADHECTEDNDDN
jgi:hypothetical protein